MFWYVFLSTTAATAQPLSQNKNYPDTNLSKFPRNTKIRLKRKLTNSFPPATRASPLVNKILETPRIKLLNSNTLIPDGIETGVLLKDFAQRLKRKNLPIPDIYFTLLDAASITPNLVVNSHAKGEERVAWITFKI